MKRSISLVASLAILMGALAAPAHAITYPVTVSGNVTTSVLGAVVTINNTVTVVDNASQNVATTVRLYACSSAEGPQLTPQTSPIQGCNLLYGDNSGAALTVGSMVNLNNVFVQAGQNFYRAFTVDDGAHISALITFDTSPNDKFIWSGTALATAPSGTNQNQQSSGQAVDPAPAKYSGPEFSALSLKPITVGSSGKLEGKRLNEISSITIDGKPAIFKLDGDKALDLTLPEGLAPGTYDLVINSSAGKLTHINAIRVREPLKSFSITSRSVGKISEEQYQEHALISAMQVPELNKARCVVNASSLAMAKAQAQRLCALVKAANPNIETTVVEARSTVKNDAVFARVSYGWTK